jgi:ABC-type Fe3+-siderophore transport system permease subunit
MSAAHLVLALGVTAVVLATLHLHAAIAHALSPATAADDVGRLLLVHAELPRLAIALLCGAGLSASGALLQQVLRNPLASPDTVGVGAGARLALVLAGLLAPQLSTAGRDLAAIAGAALTTTLVLLIARRHRFAPLALILSGLIVSLCCGAIAAIFMLLKDRYLVALFIWGSGSLSQQSWLPALGLLLRLGLCVLPVLLLVRPLSLLDAGDDTARSLGVPVERLRVLAVGVAVLAAAFVTSTVGTIGFIGLAGPMVARLCGVRGAGPTCLWSAAIGALLLLVTAGRLFAGIVPWLLLFATALFAFGPALARRVHSGQQEGRSFARWREPGLLAVAAYGGYFNGGLGVLLLALFALLGQTDLNAMNGLKNLLSAALAAIAVVLYAAGGLVRWPEAALMTAGATAGGYLGARVARRLPGAWLRRGIVVTGLAMAAAFFARG